LTLEGVFGRIFKPVTTSQLIDRGLLAALNIKQITLIHPTPDLRFWTGEYSDEIKYLCNSESRNLFLKKLVWSLSGRTLVLFSLVEHHGLHLYSLITDHNMMGVAREGTRPVYLIHGATAADEREMVRTLLRQEKEAILVASYGTLSTGVNIPELDNVVLASPSKSRIRVLQSLGRGLRLAEGKSVCNLYDIADEIPLGKKRWNFTFSHAAIRREYYKTEHFPLKQYAVRLAA
jgi:superfamily II DNA or RNA helicase